MDRESSENDENSDGRGEGSDRIEPARSEPSARERLALFIVPPLGVFILLIVSFALEGASSRHSLEAIVPEEVAIGDPLPIVARLIARRGEARFELIEDGVIKAALIREGEARLEAELSPIGGGVFIGAFEGSGGAQKVGEASLELRARGASLRVPLTYLAERRSLPLRSILPEARRSEEGPKKREKSEKRKEREERTPPLRLFIESGRCVPEFTCGLVLVDEAEPSERSLSEPPSLTLESERGLVWLGEAAQLTERALIRRAKAQNLHPLARANLGEATRLFSIPIAPGGIASELPRRSFNAEETIELAFDSLDGARPLYALYREGALIEIGRAGSRVEAEDRREGGATLQLGPLDPGEYRLELAIDPFAGEPSERSAAHRFTVSRATETRVEERLDPEAALALILEESLRAELPRSKTSASGDAGGERDEIRALRWGSAALVMLLGLAQALWGARYFRRLRPLPALDLEHDPDVDPSAEPDPEDAIGAATERRAPSPALLFTLAILIVYTLVAFIVLSRAYIFL